MTAAPAALAFAADAATQDALREGLSDRASAQVWPGTVGTAAAVLERAGDVVPRLLFVDLDDTPYPAGAVHELAAVCDADTAVVALGSDSTARFGREILLAGVSDYLVKPVAAAAVRAAAARALEPEAALPASGRAAGFAGCGGSGATTLAAAVALHAAAQGRYVAALDLGRAFPTLPFALDVEPAPGLDQLLEAPDGVGLDTVDGVAARRSDRIAVWGYRPGPILPPPPAAAAVRGLIDALAQRSHLVVVDGLEDPAARLEALAAVDLRVLVVEPTAVGAQRAARLLPLLGGQGPVVAVQNHTQAFRRRAAAKAIRAAGLPAPDFAVPFERQAPGLADRGWPKDRLPAGLRKPAAALAERLLAADGPAAAAPPPA